MTIAVTEKDSTEFLFAQSVLIKLYLAGAISISQYEYAQERARDEFNRP